MLHSPTLIGFCVPTEFWMHDNDFNSYQISNMCCLLLQEEPYWFWGKQVKGQGHRSRLLTFVSKFSFRTAVNQSILIKLPMCVAYYSRRNSIDFGIKGQFKGLDCSHSSATLEGLEIESLNFYQVCTSPRSWTSSTMSYLELLFKVTGQFVQNFKP